MVTERPKVKPLAVFNVSQTARVLGLSRPTVRKAAKLGDLKPSFNRALEMLFTGDAILKYYDLKRKPI